MDNNENAQDAIENLKARLEEDAVRESIKRKSQLFINPESQEKQGKVNLFANNDKPPSQCLFSDKRQSVNLFKMNISAKPLFDSDLQGAKNIFNLSSKPTLQDSQAKQNGNDSSASNSKSLKQDNDSPYKSNNKSVSQSADVIMKYSYEKQLEKIGEFNVVKFKCGTNPPKDQIYVTLQKAANQSGVLYLLVRNRSTKIVIFQSVLMKNISNIDKFMNRPQFLKFYVIRKNKQIQQDMKDSLPQSKMIKQIVKLQFISSDDANQFTKIINENYN